ncbi:excinuclease ABC subunit A [Pseudodonghicola flavimaris]|uniref:Excinuclease ABC subunit A n=1 Tax=Pseudodonghicola flavimaris TaxID=3050036 RepID=A0ABT7EVU0_9RHOB|nr:excinuclease ABC subunit A [Pseudodonghicola flavimaris]MDK3016409.1 excinuclease ABC subunit A [Pseudodonghicola flavimaris]
MRNKFLMTPILAAATALALSPAVMPAAALAGGPKGCPPGLAKKGNGCQPPGHAKQRYDDDYDHHHVYTRGDYLRGDYILIERPDRYGLDPRQTYYRSGDYIYLVDRDTMKVLNLIGAVAAILN